MEKENVVLKENDFARGGLERVGGKISLETVKSWTGNYRKNNKDTTSHFFGRGVIENLLKQHGCAGIRIHYAIDEKGRKQLVLSGVNRAGKDQLPKHGQKIEVHNEPHLAMATTGENDEIGELYDQSWPCPETKGCTSSV